MTKAQKKQPRLSSLDQDLLTILLGRELYGLEILEKLNLNNQSLIVI